MTQALIIDDDQVFRQLVRDILRSNGINSIEAGSGQEALDLLNKNNLPELIITDIFMPEMDGIELITKIKKDHPGIKIIAVSGGGAAGDNASLEAAQFIGADKIIEKPITPKEFLATIAEVQNS